MDADLRRALVLVKHSGQTVILIKELLEEIYLTAEDYMGIHTASSWARDRSRVRELRDHVWAPSPDSRSKGILHRWVLYPEDKGNEIYLTVCGLRTPAHRSWLRDHVALEGEKCRSCGRFHRDALVRNDLTRL